MTFPQPSNPEHPAAGRREWLALAVLSLAVFLLAVDGTVLSLAVPALSTDLNPSPVELLWIGDAYSLTLAGLLVTMGNLSDRIGRKRLLLIGSVGFGAASLLAAWASTPGMLIAARVLLGVAGATLMPSTLSIIRAMFGQARQRTTAIAIWGAIATAGAASGPLVGGFLLEHFWWGSVFVINIPVMLLLVVLGSQFIPESRNPNPGPFDPISAALSLAGIVPLVYAVKEVASGKVELPIFLAAVLGIAAAVLFIRRQNRLAHPLIEIALFHRPAFTGAVLTNFLSIFALSGLLFFLSQYLQLVQEYRPFEAGIRQLPITVASILVAGFVGRLTARLGRGRLIGVGLVLAAAGLGLLAAAEGADGYLWLAATLSLIGFGIGMALASTTDAVVSAVPADRAGSASAVSETAYELGVALGIALLGSLHTALYRDSLAESGSASTSLVTATEVAARSAPADAVQLLRSARTAFVDAMQITTLAMAAALALAAVVAWRVIPSDGDRGQSSAPSGRRILRKGQLSRFK